MGHADWSLKGPSYGNCACTQGCPCQFSELSGEDDCHGTHGHCKSMIAMQIEEGHYNDVSLNGLCWVNLYHWPGQMHEGDGAQQIIIDVRADEQQRQALQSILSGQETDPGATIFHVYATMTDTIHETLYKPIEFTHSPDDSHCSCRVVVPGIVESVADGAFHIPEDGKTAESETAGIVQRSASTRVNAQIEFDITDSHGHFRNLHITPSGVVR